MSNKVINSLEMKLPETNKLHRFETDQEIKIKLGDYYFSMKHNGF